MASGNLQWAAPKPLKLDGNVSENFCKFEEHWTLFEKTELKGRSEEERCSYFLLCIGEKGREVHKTLTFATPETETDHEGVTTWKRTTTELKSAFKIYCNPRKNITFERHKFNIRNQEENKSIDQYVTVLRTLAATCEFQTLHDGLIRDRIVCGIRNQTIKERLLPESELTPQKTLDICRASQVSRNVPPMSTHWGKISENTITEGIFAATTTNPTPENPQTIPAVIVVEFMSQNPALHMGKSAITVTN